MNVAPSARRAKAALVAFALLAPAIAGCFYSDNRYSSGNYVPGPVMSIPACPSQTGTAASVAVDTGKFISTPPGEGVGVFVEYQAGGRWHVFTACDTIFSQAGCAFDVTAQLFEGSVSNVAGDGLEPGDVTGSACADTAYLSVNTGSNLDGMVFDAPAGGPIRVTASLDGALHPDVIYWAEGDVVRNDGHSNPLDLTPTAP